MQTIYSTSSDWFKNNKQELKKFRGQWIAYSKMGIIAHNKDYQVMIKETEKITNDYKDFVIWHVHEFDFQESVRFLPIRFKMIKTHDWQPLYEIELKYKEVMKLKMLVDSGADFSLIPYQIGISLGYNLADGEIISKANGIGGSIEYVLRNIEMQIDSYLIKTPIAWAQSHNCDDIILGREVVFDAFDIEFKQVDEEIIFKKR